MECNEQIREIADAQYDGYFLVALKGDEILTQQGGTIKVDKILILLGRVIGKLPESMQQMISDFVKNNAMDLIKSKFSRK